MNILTKGTVKLTSDPPLGLTQSPPSSSSNERLIVLFTLFKLLLPRVSQLNHFLQHFASFLQFASVDETPSKLFLGGYHFLLVDILIENVLEVLFCLLPVAGHFVDLSTGESSFRVIWLSIQYAFEKPRGLRVMLGSKVRDEGDSQSGIGCQSRSTTSALANMIRPSDSLVQLNASILLNLFGKCTSFLCERNSIRPVLLLNSDLGHNTMGKDRRLELVE